MTYLIVDHIVRDKADTRCDPRVASAKGEASNTYIGGATSWKQDCFESVLEYEKGVNSAVALTTYTHVAQASRTHYPMYLQHPK